MLAAQLLRVKPSGLPRELLMYAFKREAQELPIGALPTIGKGQIRPVHELTLVVRGRRGYCDAAGVVVTTSEHAKKHERQRIYPWLSYGPVDAQ